MTDVIATCRIILSKKLEKICSNSPMFLSSVSIDKNQISARFKFGIKSGVSIEDIKKMGETSIVIKIEDVFESLNDIPDEGPIGNIYTDNVVVYEEKQPMKNPNEKRKHSNVVSAISITDPDKEIASYKNSQKYDAPDFVSSYEELKKILATIKAIDQPLPQMQKKGIRPTRLEAIEYEKLLLSSPKLPCGVYISNETGGRLCIDDLDVIMVGNEIVDLSKKSAKIIQDSRQLRTCCEKGYVKFRSRGEYLEWSENAFSGQGVAGKSSLPVFDKVDQAMDSMGRDSANTGESKFVEEKRYVKNTLAQKTKTAASGDAEINDAEIIDLGGDDNDSTMASNDEGGILENTTIEETMNEIRNKEIPLEEDMAQLVSELPTEKDSSQVESLKNQPLLSDLAKKSDKKTIRRVS